MVVMLVTICALFDPPLSFAFIVFGFSVSKMEGPEIALEPIIRVL